MEEELKKSENNVTVNAPRNPRVLRWTVSFIILILIGLCGYFVITQNLIQRASLFVSDQDAVSTTSTVAPEIPPIDVLKDPVQTYISEADVITKQGEKGTISFYPMAEYSVSAKVVSATNYSSDLQSEFIPADLALAWGDLTDPELGKGIVYTQNKRWYFYVWDSTYPGDPAYIISHSSNHHIVPATDTIKNAVIKIKKGQSVKIDGYLINVDYSLSSGGRFSQSSSLTREDSGDGACELVYVTKLQIDDKVYQ